MAAVRVVPWVLLAACGCGRLGFDLGVDVDAASSRDAARDAMRDAPPGSIVSFGERTGATHAGVTTDTMLSASQPANNYGGDDSANSAPGAPGLVRFDVSALAPGTTIDGAELHLGVDNALLGGGTAEAFALLEAWTEGSAMGAAGVANFTTRVSGTAWTNAGAAAPGSRSATLLASFTPAASNTDTTIALNAAGVAAVQGWIDAPATNFGFAVDVSAGGGTWAFVTRESTSPALRPLLVLTVH